MVLYFWGSGGLGKQQQVLQAALAFSASPSRSGHLPRNLTQEIINKKINSGPVITFWCYNFEECIDVFKMNRTLSL